jgi:membrane-associated PAP2 superfamily phosphatase
MLCNLLDVRLMLIIEEGGRVRRAVKSNPRNRLVEYRAQSLTNFSIACRLQRSIAEPLDIYWRIMAQASAAVCCVLATAKSPVAFPRRCPPGGGRSSGIVLNKIIVLAYLWSYRIGLCFVQARSRWRESNRGVTAAAEKISCCGAPAWATR